MAPSFRVMGIVNVTPDSFSDGGRWLEPRGRDRPRPPAGRRGRGDPRRRRRVDPPRRGPRAAERGAAPRRAGDRGRSRGTGAQLSIDTMKLAVAAAALAAGATLVNDVTRAAPRPRAGRRSSPSAAATCCLMHMLGEPRTMQDDPRYDDVVAEVKAFLEERLAFAVAEGIAEERIAARPRHRLRQDRRAQPRAAAPPGRDRRARAARVRRRDVAQELPRAARRPRGPARPRRRRRSRRTSSRSSAARRVFRVHDVAPTRRCAHGRGCYVARRWRLTATTTTSTTSRTLRRRRGRRGPADRGHDRDHAGSRSTPTTG